MKSGLLAYIVLSILWTLAVLPVVQGQPKVSNSEYEETTSFAFDLINKMFDRCSHVSTLSCEVHKKERYNGVYAEARSLVKMSTSPYAVYLKQLDGGSGAEVLYRESANNGKILVNPNGFPWFNLNLDPHSSIMRNKQHHIIHDIGFSKFNRVLDHLLNKYEHNAHELVRYIDNDVINDRPCHVVEIVNNYYHLMAYTPGPDETTHSISEKFKISEYRIVELNASVSGYGSVAAGTRLIIPNDYAPRIKLYIDQQRLIPMRFEVYDDDGLLYEAYQYDRVELNTLFKDNELTADFPDYGF